MKFKLQMVATLVGIAFPMMASAQEEGKPAGRRPIMQRPGAGAESGGGPGGPGFPGSPMGIMQMMPLMKVLDTDHDGTLSASEIANASKALLQLDKNGDGIISSEEMRPDPNAMPGGFAGAGPGAGGQFNGAMMGKMFERSDANGDGKLTGDEIPERMRDKIAMIDKDGDGSITKSEFAAMAARMEEGAGKRPGKEGSAGGAVKPKRPK